MTETRKQIIELIGDYMDKTVSEGCWLIDNNGLYIRCLGELWNECGTTFLHFAEGKTILEWRDKPDRCYFKRLGHYDITAVLKYIDKNIGQLKIVCENDVLHLNNHYMAKTFVGYKRDRKYLGKIPNKPLSLYSSKEELELLELLTKLSNA